MVIREGISNIQLYDSGKSGRLFLQTVAFALDPVPRMPYPVPRTPYPVSRTPYPHPVSSIPHPIFYILYSVSRLLYPVPWKN